MIVHPHVEAEFTFAEALGCNPLEVTFENLTIGGLNYTWDFGDGTVISTMDPGPQTHIFINNDFNNIQDFEVILLAENAAGCSSEKRKTVRVYPDIQAGFTASVTEGCHPLSVDFNNLSNGAQTYVWNFGDGSTSNLQDPSRTFTNTGTVDSIYTVTLVGIAPNNVCRDTISLDITVHPYIQANFIIPDPLGCNPFAVIIENSSTNASLYRWDFGDGTDTVTVTTDPFVHQFINTNFTNQIHYEITLVAENFAGCTSEMKRTITVEPDINAAFNASQVMGCHPLDVDFTNLSNGAEYYLWDFGDGTTSQLDNPSQTFTNLGSTDTTYRVWLHATASNHVCRDSVYIDIVVHPYINADFTFLENIQCSPSTVQFNNASIGGVTYYWDFGDDSDAITTDLNPVVHIFNNSSYINNEIFQVSLIAENAAGCIHDVTKIVEVYPDIDASFSMNVSEGCHPLEVDFTNLSDGGYTYSWDFGDGSSSDADAPSHTYTNFSDAPITRQIRLTADSWFNCTSEITAEITIHPRPRARFETDRIIDCPPFDLPMVNTSLNADQYTWIFGDGDTLQTNSPAPVNHVYGNATADIATYELTLRAASTYGCMDSSQQKIYVYPGTSADFSFNNEGCSPLSVHFTNESVRGYSYLWDFGDGTTMTIKDPTNIYFNLSDHDIIYYVNLTTTSEHGCVDSRSDSIFVYAQPEAEFIALPTHQEYPASTVSLDNMTNPGTWNHFWDLGDGSTSILEDPQPHTYANWGEYKINLHVSSAHCADSISHTIRIFPAAPIADFDTVYPGCEPLTIQFTNNSMYGDSYLWEFDDGSTSTEFEPSHTFTEFGIYNVKLTVTGDGGRDYAYSQVEVYRIPVVNFRVAPEEVMLPDQEIKLFNLSEHGTIYLWDFGDGNTSSDESPRYLYSELGTYDISLDVWTENGCTDRLVKPGAVTVLGKGLVMFPNAFKPDMTGPNGGYYTMGEPEKNNIFHPYWEGVEEYHLMIYSRWGELVFTSDDVNIGWDGYIEGKLAMQDAYAWKCWGIFSNGKAFNLVGDVTLLYHDKR
jgi:PKD repeat protein